MKIPVSFLKALIKLPLTNRYSRKWYKILGVNLTSSSRVARDLRLVGSYSNLKLGLNSEINAGCFLLASESITIGENSTLAYQVTVLTSANPNGPLNKLAKIYKPIKLPVYIGDNAWIGAKAIILPGIRIGNFSIVAAGSVVNRDVPDYTVVAGVPARIIKNLDPNELK